MRFLDLTLKTPQENLALDEVLLEWCDRGEFKEEIMRFWESPAYFVVTGRGNSVDLEVYVERCEKDSIPILRQCSGGGTVLQGPGCLNYCLILNCEERGIHTVTGINRLVMESHRQAFFSLLPNSQVKGITDLTDDETKFSGNAQRKKKNWALFHGTFLLNFNLEFIERYLKMPSKFPDYRADRSHQHFLKNIEIESEKIKAVLKKCWSAEKSLKNWPQDNLKELVKTKYSQDSWNFEK